MGMRSAALSFLIVLVLLGGSTEAGYSSLSSSSMETELKFSKNIDIN